MTIELLKEQIAFAKRTMKSKNSGYMEGYLCALSAVEGMVAEIEEKNGWIPVKDGRPPERDGWYITTYDGSKYNEGERAVGMTRFEDGGWIEDDVYAWMELPSAYTEEAEDEGVSGTENKAGSGGEEHHP
jgi:hypothetical protein